MDFPVAICILVRLKHLTTQEENIGVRILNDSQIYFLFKYTKDLENEQILDDKSTNCSSLALKAFQVLGKYVLGTRNKHA